MKNALSLLPLALVAASLCTAAQAQEAKAGDAAVGATKAAMCIGCHGIVGYQASFPEVYKVPMIAGQSAKYIISALPPTTRASASTRRCAASPPA